MKVKEIDRTVNVAWSPVSQYPILLAAGTAAQQLDSSFSTAAGLELYALNLGEPGLDMDLKVVAPSDNRFHKIAWGPFGPVHEKGSGIIVGGCDGGRMQIYSVSKLLSGEEGLIVTQEKHSGPVQCLDFNPFQSNLLATGASESEIFIWDLNNVSTPMTPGAKAQPPENVISMAWNRQVQHILASTFAQRCVVWDLRKNEPIIKLSDGTTRIRWKVVSWHPEVATQMCLASEDDQSPVIQLWDLRFATSPLKVLENHQRGVLSIAWCSQDPELLVSCGKDGRILCWNPESSQPGGEVVCEVTTNNQWNFDISWCPRNPALIASSSFDGHVSIYSLLGGQPQMQTSNKIADSFPGMEVYAQAPVPQQQQTTVDLRKPPKWLRRPVGASFGFGGKLVAFENLNVLTTAPGSGGSPARIVKISQVVTEPELIQRSSLLESTLQSGQFVEFCQNKAAASVSAHEKHLWSFLKANFTTSPRTELLNLLGFKQEEVKSKLNRLLDKPANARPDPAVDNITNGIAGLTREGPEGDASAAFDAIAAENQFIKDGKTSEPMKIPVGDDVDGLISQALLLGDIESAVELCLSDGRMADAIVLAISGGQDLLERTRRQYFQQSKGQISTLISAVVTADWNQIVRGCEVDSWKEALAATLTYANNEEFAPLCEQLGHRLEREGKGPQQLNAQLCYICSGSINRLVDCWSETVKPESPNKLQDLVELVMVLFKAAEFQGKSVSISGSLAQLLSQYASILASQGNLTAALTYLSSGEDETVNKLRDRLCVAMLLKPSHEAQQLTQQQPLHQQPNRLPMQRKYSSGYHSSPGMPSSQPAYQTPGRVQSPMLSQQSPSYNVFQPQQQPQASPLSSSGYPINQTFQSGERKSYSPVPSIPITAQPSSAQSFTPPMAVRQPPPMPPPSVTPTAGGSSPSVSGSRSKPYVLDPSVQSGSIYGITPAVSTFNPTPSVSQAPTYTFQPNVTSFAQQPVGSTSMNYVQPNPGFVTESTPPAPNPPVLPANVPAANAPPGWNDPPALKGIPRSQPKPEFQPPAPITHPLYGSVQQDPGPVLPDANMAMNGVYGDPNAMNVSGHPQHIPQFPQHSQHPQHPQHPQHYQHPQHSQHPQLPQHPQHVALQHMQSSPKPPQQHSVVSRGVEPPKPKGPVPEEHMYLQTVFNELRDRCSNTANNPQAKRKLEDVARKLEVLYDALRENKLSANTLSELHQMVQMVQTGNYTGGLVLHTQLVCGPDFSQIASFMPGLKVLLQLALQLGVYLQ